MKLIEVQATKEFASSFLPDIFLKMAVNRVLDAVPGFELVRCKECKWFNHIGCAIKIVDDSDKPKETDFCSFGERKTE